MEPLKKPDVNDMVAEGKATIDMRRVHLDPDVLALDWPKPTPLSVADAVPPFPTDALPAPWREWLEAEAVQMQVAPEVPFVFSLGAHATILGPRVRVAAKDSWVENVNLYVGAVLPPGEKKSPCLSNATAPIRKIEQSLIDAAKPRIADALRRREILEIDVARAKAAYQKCRPEKRDELREDYEEARRKLDEAPPPIEPRLIVGDATPERLSAMLAEQNGGLAMISGEDSLIGHLSGRYSKSPAMEVVLSAYSNEAVMVDRKGSPSVRIDRPALSIVLGLQPSVVLQAMGNDAIKGRGLLDRFILVSRPSNVGFRDTDPPDMPDRVRDAYERALLSIARAVAMTGAEITIGLSAEARSIWKDWQAKHELDRGPAGRFHSIQSWCSKNDGRSLRLAAILHIAEHEGTQMSSPVSALAMRRAVKIMDVLAAHAVAIADLAGTDVSLVNARDVLRWAVERVGPGGVVSKRDVQRAFEGRFKSADNTQAVLELLKRHGLAHNLPKRSGNKGGRPIEPWAISPRAAEVLSVLSNVTKSQSENLQLHLLTRSRAANLETPTNDNTDNTSDAWSPRKCAEELGESEDTLTKANVEGHVEPPPPPAGLHSDARVRAHAIDIGERETFDAKCSARGWRTANARELAKVMPLVEQHYAHLDALLDEVEASRPSPGLEFARLLEIAKRWSA